MSKELTIDPELRDLLPHHHDDELLKKQLQEEGCRDPIVTWANHEDTIIDGHRRYRLCMELDIPFKIVALPFPDKLAVSAWMWNNQDNRRNMTPQDIKLGRAAMYKLAKKESEAQPGNQKASKTSEKNGVQKLHPVLKTAEKVAETTGVSPRTIHNDVKFKEALDKVAPLVKDKIDGKRVRASTAELERLAELPATQQRSVVDAVISGEAKTIAGAMPATAPTQQSETAPELKDLNKLLELLGKAVRQADDINRDLFPSKHHATVVASLDEACKAATLWKQGAKKR